MVNLNLLRLFYFFKKEFYIIFTMMINIQKRRKLFNILKSPVQYKIARNQLKLEKHKVTGFVEVLSNKMLLLSNMKKNYKLLYVFTLGIITQLIHHSVNSSCIYNLNKIIRV